MESFKQLGDPKIKVLVGLGICLFAALLLHFSQTGERLSRKVLDKQFDLLRRYDPRPVDNEVVIVGIDDSAFRAFKEPFALWHPHLGKFLQAMAAAKPAVVGLDIVLPEHSYQFLVPGYDQNLLQGLRELKAQAPVILAQTLDDSGVIRPVYEAYISTSGGNAPASVEVCADDDGVARRFDPNLCTVNAQGSTLVEMMAAYLGNAKPGTGLVDFSKGEKFEYIPFIKVLEWQAQGNGEQLVRTFGGKPVLLGIVSLQGDRATVPVPLAAWDGSNRHIPGVLMQAQILRSMQNGGLIRDGASTYVVLILTLLSALLWLGRIGWTKIAILATLPPLVLFFSTWQLGQGVYLPIGGILFSSLFVIVARMVYEGVLQMQQRNWLRGMFGSYVSPEVLEEIMAGNIHSGLDGVRIRLCILVANIHDFSGRCESQPPQEIVALLNDHFSEMTIAIHRHKGTVDKFVGDGLMAFFGAPHALECPEKNALEAAQEMLQRLRHVNERLREKSVAPIEVGIALHVGEVVIGHIGSELRHDYTVIGDAVSRTTKLEALTKTLNYPVVCSAVVAKAVENSGGLVDCGEQTVKGGTIHVYGWKPPLLAAN